MKILKFIFTILLTLIIFGVVSCNKKKESPPPTSSTTSSPAPIITTSNTWKMNTYTYVQGTSSSGYYNGVSSIVISTSGFSNANGAFSGSSISFVFWGNAVGTYTIQSFSTVGQAYSTNPSLKYISISSNVGTEFPNTTKYDSQDSNLTAEVSLENGKYHITISNPIVLTKGVSVGTGVPNAPSTFTFTCDNVH